MRPRLGALAVLAMVLAATACGGGTGPGASSTPSGDRSPTSTAPTPTTSPSTGPTAGSTGSPTAGGSQLTIVVDDGAGTTTTWTLTCDPVGGSHPEPERACAVVEKNRSALDPVPKDKMCAQVYSGPQRATVSGTWRHEQVQASLSRINSCETARWDALDPLLPAGGR